RDRNVTGVQTCALPISPSGLQAELLKAIAQRVPGDAEALSGLGLVSGRLAHRSLDHRLFPLSEVDALRRQRGRASARLRRRRAKIGRASCREGGASAAW